LEIGLGIRSVYSLQNHISVTQGQERCQN